LGFDELAVVCVPDSAINTLSVLTNRSTDHRMSDDLLPKRVREIRDLEKGEVSFNTILLDLV